MPFAAVGGAIAGGLATGVGGALVSGLMSGGGPSGGGGGGGGGTQAVYNPQSLGQTLTSILGGGVAAGLGLSGITGTNLNQLQAGATAANPFGQYAAGFVPQLQQELLGGLQGQASSAQSQEMNFLQQLMGQTTGLTGAANISTPGQTAQLQSMTQHPTQLLQTLQGGGLQTPGGIQNILSQDPYSFTQGEQFQYKQGLGALQATQLAQGLSGSGAQAIQAEQYGQNFASQATQQNIQNLFGAQGANVSTFGANQGLQQIVNSMGQSEFGNTLQLGQFMGQQQQGTFNNLSQQQNLQQGLLSQMFGINNAPINVGLQTLNPLLTATQASSSSPATAGGILANLGVANQTSGANLGSGLGGLASGLGNALSGINFGGGGNDYSSSNPVGGYSGELYGPSGFSNFNPSNYYSGGGNTFGFTGGGGTDWTGGGGNTFGFTM